jgi:hypothetical protein
VGSGEGNGYAARRGGGDGVHVVDSVGVVARFKYGVTRRDMDIAPPRPYFVGVSDENRLATPFHAGGDTS